MASSSNSKVIRASRDTVWDILVDMESWPDWAPKAQNRITYHHILEKQGNTIICEERLNAGPFLKTKSIDRYIISPTKERLDEIIMTGDLQGGFEMTLSDGSQGTVVSVNATISPRNFILRIIDLFFGKMILHKFWEDLLEQLAVRAETADRR